MPSESPVLLHASQKRTFGLSNRIQYVQRVDGSNRAFFGMSKLAANALRHNVATSNFDKLSRPPKFPQEANIAQATPEKKPNPPKHDNFPHDFGHAIFGIERTHSKAIKAPPSMAPQKATRYSCNSSWTHCSKTLVQADQKCDQYIDEQVWLPNLAAVL